MAETSIIHNTFVIERTYPKPPSTVFAALSDPAKKRRWFAEGDHHDAEHFELDFRIGGRERATFRFRPGTPFAGVTTSCDNVHLDIVDGRRVVIASRMELGGRPISASLVTFELLADGDNGTRLILTHQAAFFEGSDGPERRQHGWLVILDRLERHLSQ